MAALLASIAFLEAASSAASATFLSATAFLAAASSSGVSFVLVAPVWHLSPSPQPYPVALPSHFIPAVLPTAAVLAASVVVAASAAITVEAIRAATMKLFIVSF